MAADDTPDDGEATDSDGSGGDNTPDVRERLEQEADRARSQFDENVIDLLSWILDTETQARIYIYLCQHPDSTSDEVASGTGLYPSTVREALVELHDEEHVTRTKRENDGAGNNPYEYSAFPPSELVSEMVGDVQQQLNTVFNLDDYINGSDDSGDSEPVTITVRDEHQEGTADVLDVQSSDDTATGDAR